MIPSYNTVVFSGGGTRGIAFAGALEVLRKKENIDWGLRCPPLKNVCGCSIGALLALLISLEFSANEISDLLMNTSFHQLVNLDPMQILKVATSGLLGLDTGTTLQTFLCKQIARKTIYDSHSSLSLTFEELYKMKKINLVVVATNLNSKCLETFSYEVTPKVSVVEAVRASMALPPLFEPVSIQGNLLSDGGLIENFPMHLFSSEEVLGLRLASETKTVEEMKQSALPLIPFLNHVTKISSMAADASAWYSLSETVRKERVINIPCGKVSSFETDVTAQLKDFLFKSGETAAKNFMERKTADVQDIQVWKECLPKHVHKLIQNKND
jgi:NTE family protein